MDSLQDSKKPQRHVQARGGSKRRGEERQLSASSNRQIVRSGNGIALHAEGPKGKEGGRGYKNLNNS